MKILCIEITNISGTPVMVLSILDSLLISPALAICNTILKSISISYLKKTVLKFNTVFIYQLVWNTTKYHLAF